MNKQKLDNLNNRLRCNPDNMATKPAGTATVANILVVDDEKSIRGLFKSVLENTGSYNVGTVKNFYEAEAHLQKHAIDAVFLDINLPQISGIELLKRIEDFQADTPVIIITGYPTVETASEAIRWKAYDYLTKPISLETLLRVTRNAVAAKKSIEAKKLAEIKNKNYQQNLITARKRAEEEISLLVAVVEQAAYGIAITDSEWTIQYANRQFETLTGDSRKDIVHHRYNIAENDRPAVERSLSQLEGVSKDTPWRGTSTIYGKDGSLREVETTISPLTAGRENRYYNVISKYDVTEKKRLESIAAAANLMENIGYVFSGIRHEIGNPINSIKMTLSVLESNLAKFDRKTVNEFLARSLNEINRVEYLLKALRNFNMFENPTIQPTQINPFVEKFLLLAEADFKKQGIMVKTVPARGLVQTLVDPRALQQVMLNLMTNAADALANRDNPTITIRVRAIPDFIRISVEDNGCGISCDRQKNLFKPFFTSKPNGTGLGLVIAKKMLSEMNCTIDIKSRVNVGTEVTICMPQAKHHETIES
jgi:PAS domain S-box-containing protein